MVKIYQHHVHLRQINDGVYVNFLSVARSLSDLKLQRFFISSSSWLKQNAKSSNLCCFVWEVTLNVRLFVDLSKVTK